MQSIKTYIKNPDKFLLAVLCKFAWAFPDKPFLKMSYRLHLGRKLDLKDPKRFTEKIQWLKLYNRKDEYTTMVDKYAVKEFVANKIGEQYIIPTLGVWNHFDEIDFDLLPERFVLKTTHGGGGGGIVICKDKAKLDKKKARKVLEGSLKHSIYTTYREWPYKNVPRRIIAEKFISSGYNEDLTDFKFYCFDGVPRVCKVDFGRFSKEGHKANFYDMNWNLLDVELNYYPSDKTHIEECPQNFEQMVALASQLSEGYPFLRVDLYNLSGVLYFGELTFSPDSGFCKFLPEQWDTTLGDMLSLKTVKRRS